MEILNAHKYKGDYEDLQLELIELRKKITVDIANNLKPAFKEIIKIKESLPCNESVIDDSLKLYSTFWNVDNLGEKPKGTGVVYFYEGGLYIQFFGISNVLLKDFLSKNFEVFEFEDFRCPIKNAKGEKISNEERDSIYQQKFLCGESEINKRRTVWEGIFKDEGVPSYRGLTFSVLHQHIFDLTIKKLHQEILKETNPKLFNSQQNEKRDKLSRSIIDSLLRGIDISITDIKKHFEYHGIIAESNGEPKAFLDAVREEALIIKKQVNKEIKNKEDKEKTKALPKVDKEKNPFD